jgi:hypothetical protein
VHNEKLHDMYCTAVIRVINLRRIRLAELVTPGGKNY